MDVFISIPFDLLLEKYLPLVIENKIDIEIILKQEALDTYSVSEFKKVGDQLLENEIKITIHLPYMDLSLGALDPLIKEISLKRIFQGMEISTIFSPKNLVFHTGFHPFYHRTVVEEWKKIFKDSLEKIIKKGEELELTLSLENVFEPEPEFLKEFLEPFQGKIFWCFDPGHAKIFSKKSEIEWLEVLSPYLKEIHCHDNRGEVDEHLAIGKGIINFENIWNFLRKKHIKPLLVSEAHTKEETLYNREYLLNLKL